MSTEEWTLLVKRVDALIAALRHARAEAGRWRTRAAELERLHLEPPRPGLLESEKKELERLRKERKKVIATVTRILGDIDKAQAMITERDKHE